MKLTVWTWGKASREPRAGRTRGALDEANVGKGTALRLCNAGDSPGSRDVSPGSRATSTTGRGNECRNDTSKRRERSVPTSGWCIQSTQETSQQPWILSEEPLAPNPANQVAFERWKYVYKEYMNKVQEYTNFLTGL